MELRLVRTPGQHDRAYVRLDDGQTRSWTFPSYGVMLPHDLVHLLVEGGLWHSGWLLGPRGRWARPGQDQR
ncbi:MAG: hypothetical protein IPI35_18545 [Deltaproteobacteria bacterium]|nr:hypothetical protein [Deltaproteobacteria bacterium]